MSTNNECEFVEVKPGKWYYVLEDYSAPKNAWDWREYATAYGPFKTEEAAATHLQRNHANPGGSFTLEYEEGFEPDSTLAKLITKTPKWTR